MLLSLFVSFITPFACTCSRECIIWFIHTSVHMYVLCLPLRLKAPREDHNWVSIAMRWGNLSLSHTLCVSDFNFCRLSQLATPFIIQLSSLEGKCSAGWPLLCIFLTFLLTISHLNSIVGAFVLFSTICKLKALEHKVSHWIKICLLSWVNIYSLIGSFLQGLVDRFACVRLYTCVYT